MAIDSQEKQVIGRKLYKLGLWLCSCFAPDEDGSISFDDTEFKLAKKKLRKLLFYVVISAID